MMDKIVGRVTGAPLANAKGGVIKKDANKKDVGKKDARKKDVQKDVEKVTNEKPLSIVRLIEREAMILESDVHPAIARDHQILYYRLEMIGMYVCMYVSNVCLDLMFLLRLGLVFEVSL